MRFIIFSEETMGFSKPLLKIQEAYWNLEWSSVVEELRLPCISRDDLYFSLISSIRSHISISSINSSVWFLSRSQGFCGFQHTTLPIAQEDLKELFRNHQYTQSSDAFQQLLLLAKFLLLTKSSNLKIFLTSLSTKKKSK